MFERVRATISLPAFAWAEGAREVALFADTFNTYFEPENLRAAVAVLTRLGYRVSVLQAAARNGTVGPARPCAAAARSSQPDSSRKPATRRGVSWMRRKPFIARGVPILGLEPSCLLTLRDEFLSMLPGEEAESLAKHALLFEEFLAQRNRCRRASPTRSRGTRRTFCVHGHCHQKAFAAMPAVQKTLGLIEGLKVETVESSCCGMAGAFGYGADTHEASMAMAELSLLPAIRKAAADTIIAAGGFSCRHQIADGSGRAGRPYCDLVTQGAAAGGR